MISLLKPLGRHLIVKRKSPLLFLLRLRANLPFWPGPGLDRAVVLLDQFKSFLWIDIPRDDERRVRWLIISFEKLPKIFCCDSKEVLGVPNHWPLVRMDPVRKPPQRLLH